uniref:Uncharacterized protein n=1 Tax=Anguilla anguilla TaxID=7936 RepID=A0A0E9PU69_ANGAN
MSISVRYIRLK